MSWIKKALIILFFALAAWFLFDQARAEAQSEGQLLRVGHVLGPDRIILERLKEITSRRGQELELVIFSSPEESLKALAEGQIHLSVSQHKPQLEAFVLETKAKLISLGNIYVAPMAFYSQTIKTLAEIGAGARIAVQDEADKRRRAYQLLSQNGLIKLNGEVEWPTKNDIVENPLNLNFVEATVLRTLVGDSSITAIAFSGLSKDMASLAEKTSHFKPLCQEDVASSYVMVVAARASRRENPWLLDFMRDYQSLEMAQFLLENFNGTIIPVFDFNRPF
ncbi:MAG: hypothetical protein LBT38_03630 [Deltaproteobacteria bacterium]|nr:hypothetical protein [Deltaproteobacteria bacterium]